MQRNRLAKANTFAMLREVVPRKDDIMASTRAVNTGRPSCAWSSSVTYALIYPDCSSCCTRRAQGVGVVFISHNVRHAMAVGDRFTVLNRGKTLGTAVRGEITSEQLQDLMAGGQELAQLESTLGGTV